MGFVIDIFLPLALAFIMFNLGLGLTFNDFLRVVKQPRDFFVGALSQIILLPIIAYIFVKIWPIAPELAIGVMIISAAPGGVTSNLLTSFAKGDVALSISLTAVISLLSVITVPFIVVNSVELLSETKLNENISLINIAKNMFLIVTIPVVLGMLFKKFISKISLAFETIGKKLSIAFFVIVLIGAIISQKENIVSYFLQAGLMTLALNVVMMLIAYYLGQLLCTGVKQKKCITIECGLQNGTLAIFVATSIFGDNSLYLIPAATYSLIMFFTSLIFVYLVKDKI